jgi:L-ribulose-5-phosphate 4-epimerase
VRFAGPPGTNIGQTPAGIVPVRAPFGVIGVDKDPYEAVLKSAYLEEMAQIYYHALVINGGKEPESFAPEELQRWAYPSQIKFSR